MSRAAVYSYHHNPIYTEISTSPIVWTEMLDSITYQSNVLSGNPIIDEVNMFHFIDKEAGLIAAALYNIEKFIQTSLVSKHLAQVSLSTDDKRDLDFENDIWVDMPPYSAQKVKMKARYMGHGKPLPLSDESEEN